MSHRVLNIGHRGASATRPENTVASFRRAMEIGADMIELDVRATADGIAVVMHDSTVDRTTNGSGRLADLTLKQVEELDAGSWFAPDFAGERVPTLEQVVALTAGKTPLSIELKESGVEEQAVGAVRRLACLERSREAHLERSRRADGRTFISSFHDECLMRVRELAPEPAPSASSGQALSGAEGIEVELIVGIDPLSSEEIAALIRRAQRLGARILAPSYRGLTRELVAAATAAGLRLITWTVNEREEMARMMEFGIWGITTNYPEVLKDLLG